MVGQMQMHYIQIFWAKRCPPSVLLPLLLLCCVFFRKVNDQMITFSILLLCYDHIDSLLIRRQVGPHHLHHNEVAGSVD